MGTEKAPFFHEKEIEIEEKAWQIWKEPSGF
jgi:hypothetical protein